MYDLALGVDVERAALSRQELSSGRDPEENSVAIALH